MTDRNELPMLKAPVEPTGPEVLMATPLPIDAVELMQNDVVSQTTKSCVGSS